MRKPEDIQYDINILEKELVKSKMEHNFKFLCDDSWGTEMIGYFNIGNVRIILEELNQGTVLQFRHTVFDEVTVFMNQQRNRIYVSDNKNITQDNIIGYMFWHSGTWYINVKETQERKNEE